MIFRKIYFFIIIPAIIIFTILVCLVYYFSFTNAGSHKLLNFLTSKYSNVAKITVGNINGVIIKSLKLNNVVISDLKFLPKRSIITIKELEVSFSSISIGGLKLKINKGYAKIPGFETIFFYGKLTDDDLDINIYFKNININEALRLFVKSGSILKTSGDIADLDVYITGKINKPQLNGTFKITKLSRNWFSIIDSPGELYLEFVNIPYEIKPFGSLYLNQGTFIGPRDITVDMQRSELIFTGDIKKPNLNMKGVSIIEETKINLTLQGVLGKPQLKLTSEESIPQEGLMFMLITGKSWKVAEKTFQQGQLSPDLVAEFIDYFVFSGSGSKLAQYLGIKNIALDLEKQKQEIAIIKNVNEKVDATYKISQLENTKGDAKTIQAVGGEYKITNNISVGAEKEITTKKENTSQENNDKANDKVFIKVKQKF